MEIKYFQKSLIICNRWKMLRKMEDFTFKNYRSDYQVIKQKSLRFNNLRLPTNLNLTKLKTYTNLQKPRLSSLKYNFNCIIASDCSTFH